jgi:hypothetical protein
VDRGEYWYLLRKRWHSPPEEPGSRDVCENGSARQDQQPRSHLADEGVISGKARRFAPKDTVADTQVADPPNLAPDELLVDMHPARMIVDRAACRTTASTCGKGCAECARWVSFGPKP